MSDFQKGFGFIEIFATASVGIVLTVYGFIIRTCYNRIWEIPEKYMLKQDCQKTRDENREDKKDLHDRIDALGEKMDGHFVEFEKILREYAERRNEKRG